MSAVWKCDTCNAFLCRLCTEMVQGVDCCAACKSPCRKLTPEELGTAARAQTTVLRPGLAPLTPLASIASKPAGITAAAAAVAPAPREPVTKGGFTGFAPPGAATSAPKPAPAPGSTGFVSGSGAGPAVSAQMSRPAESRFQAPEKKEEATQPPAGERKGPYFCKNHPKVKATRSCAHCTREYCDACAKTIEGNPRCPECGGQINAIRPEEQGLPPRTVAANLIDALTFPFRGSGKLMMLLGGLFYYFSMFGGPKGRVGGLAFMYAYGMKVCRTSATGRESPPDWPALQDLPGSVSFVLCWLVSRVPAVLFVVVIMHWPLLDFYLDDEYHGESESRSHAGAGDNDGESGAHSAATKFLAGSEASEKFKEDEKAKEEATRQEQERQQELRDAAQKERDEAQKRAYAVKVLPYYALSLLGDIYLPMALLAVILYRSYGVLNPLFVFGSIARAGGGYLAAMLAMAFGDLLNFVPEILQRELGYDMIVSKLVVPFFVAFGFVYVLMVYMRALGVMYYFNQKKLQWFT